jgi:aryl-alcohol dehydrogenase-like predicted oxidoreductase
MRKMNRREFLGTVGAAGIGASLTGNTFAQELPLALQRRDLGKTGLRPTFLGMGTGTKSWNKESDQNRQGREPFVRTLIHAYECGVRYYDVADMYGSHDYLRDAMKRKAIPRNEVMILTKSSSDNPATVKEDLERFRKELDTDYLDVVLMHCMMSGKWPEERKACMDVLEEAKQKGILKAHGVSCHNFDALKRAAEVPWTDVVLARLNPFQSHMDGPMEEVQKVLQRARDNGKGVVGMKILGEGKLADRKDECLQFAARQTCFSAITIGFVKPEEIDDVIARLKPGTA